MLDFIFGEGDAATIIIVVLALAATLIALRRALPTQNVVVAAILIAIISGIIQSIGAKTGVPFGPFFYTENFGPLLFHLLPWPVPLVWIVAVLNSRGVARLILRPWRDRPNAGIHSLALTCLLAVIFDASLEPFAARTSHFWIWQIPKTIPAWYGAPWINFLAWAVVNLFILGFITPWLINKKPAVEPPEFLSLAIWFVLMLLLAAANAAHHLWLAATFGLIMTAVTAIFALRNARN